MRVLSLNVWCGKLLDPVLKFLRGADALCLQEVLDSRFEATAEICGVEGARLNLFDELSANLPEYRGIFCPSVLTYPTDPHLGYAAVHCGIATFVRRDITLVRQFTGFVHESYAVIPPSTPPLPRTAHSFTVWNERLGEEIGITHMHGLWTPGNPTSKQDTPERADQAKLLARLALQAPVSRRIACGDWNVLPESKTFDILGRIGLNDLVRGRGFTDTRTSHYEKPVRYADYMCVTSNIKVESFEVVKEPEVSDHRPLVLDFE